MVSALTHAGTDARSVYVRAGDPEAIPLDGAVLEELRAELDRLAPAESDVPEDAALAELVAAAAAWSGQEAHRYADLFAAAERAPERDVLVR